MRGKQKNSEIEEVVGVFLNLFLTVGAIFYKAWLALIVWNWFLADKLFDLTYWGMFLGLFIVGFFTSGFLGKLDTKEKIDYSSGVKIVLPVSTVTRNLIGSLFLNTLAFGIIWLVYVIIT